MAGEPINIDMSVVNQIVHSDAVKNVLMAIANGMVDDANKIYDTQAKYRSAPPYIYTRSWQVVYSTGDGSVSIENTDPDALMVEVGGHAGGKTRVLGYAPLRQAADAARAKWLDRKAQ